MDGGTCMRYSRESVNKVNIVDSQGLKCQHYVKVIRTIVKSKAGSG